MSFFLFHCLKHVPHCFIYALITPLSITAFIWLLIFYEDSWHLANFSSFSLLIFEISTSHLSTTSDYLKGILDYSDSSFDFRWGPCYFKIQVTSRQKMESVVMSSPIQTVWIMLFTHLTTILEKLFNIFITNVFLILYLSHPALVIVNKLLGLF